MRFNGNVIRTLGQTESVVAIFVGTTVQEFYGTLFFINFFALASSVLFIFFSDSYGFYILIIKALEV